MECCLDFVLGLVCRHRMVASCSLSCLFNLTISSSITAKGWAAFSKLLCDTSSVNNTNLSNHTLLEIGWCDTPQDIVQYLELNKLQNQAAAICKILQCHPDIDITPLFEVNLKCLPLAVEWWVTWLG